MAEIEPEILTAVIALARRLPGETDLDRARILRILACALFEAVEAVEKLERIKLPCSEID